MGSGEMMRPDIPREVVDLLYLCGKALRCEPAEPERVCAMDLACVHRLASSQSLSALAWYGLEPVASQAGLDEALAGTWRNERDQAVRRQMLFDAERTQVLAWLEQQGIWYVPLKGAVLAGWYPRLGMRELSDNDILFDPSRREDVASFFVGRGYRRNAENHGSTHDDTYTKRPIYNYEMHLCLFSDYDSPSFARYYEGIEGRLLPEDGSPYGRRLSSEDFLLFQVAHAHKHFQLGGTGVRVLCDLSVLLSRSGADLDWDYVHEELEKLGVASFGLSLERLVSRVFEEDFDPSLLSDEDAGTLRELTSYGTFGTVSHQTELTLDRRAERGESIGGYVLGRIVPDDDWWSVSFPYAHDHRWARIPMLLYRYVRALAQPERRARIAEELGVILRKARGER